MLRGAHVQPSTLLFSLLFLLGVAFLPRLSRPSVLVLARPCSAGSELGAVGVTHCESEKGALLHSAGRRQGREQQGSGLQRATAGQARSTWRKHCPTEPLIAPWGRVEESHVAAGGLLGDQGQREADAPQNTGAQLPSPGQPEAVGQEWMMVKR